MAIINPQNLPATRLGTPGPLDLGKGVSLFPPLPVIDLGAGAGYTVIDHDGVQVALSGFVGILGPALANELTMGGVYGGYDGIPNSNAMFVSLSDAQTIGGIVAGIAFGGTASLDVGYLWFSIDASVQFDVDLLSLIANYVIGKIGSASTLQKVLSNLPSRYPELTSSFAIFGGTNDSYADGGSVTFSAPFLFPINIWTDLVLLDVLFLLFGGAVEAFNDAISGVGISITIGPEVGFSLDTTVRVTALTLGGVSFDELAIGGGMVTAATQAALPANPQSAGITFSHASSLDFLFGFVAGVSLFWQVINISASVEWDISQSLGIPSISLDSGTFALQNTVGASSVSHQGWEITFA